jgi:hypothetical protein
LRKRQKHSIGGRAVQGSRQTFRHSNGIAKGVAKNLAALPLAPSGLKTTQRAILAEIGRSEPTTVGALADALVMDDEAELLDGKAEVSSRGTGGERRSPPISG